MPETIRGERRLAWREAGHGAPALLLHGMLAHSGAWAGVM
jgi:pimeloyl-ACP methyl ester carboxylesterase